MARRPRLALGALAVGAWCLLGGCARVSSPETEGRGQGPLPGPDVPTPAETPAETPAASGPITSVGPRTHPFADAAAEPPAPHEEVGDAHAETARPSDAVAVVTVAGEPQGLPLPAPAAPRTTLRSTPIGEMPVFDPDTVYTLGFSTETANNAALAIAPVEIPDDSVGRIGYFSKGWIGAEGRLFYQDSNVGNPVRELIRDELPTVFPEGSDGYPYHDGEPIHASSLPCEPNETVQMTQRRYLFGLDGSFLHTCANDDSMPREETDVMTWYDADGALVYASELRPLRLGAQQRLLGELDGALVVVDLDSGRELGRIELGDQAVVAARAREDGFLIALLGSAFDDRVWVDLDLEGTELARGSYAPLPEGTFYVATGNSWALRIGAIDAAGRLYEFAGSGDLPVVVRRPRNGVSDVPYRGDVEDPPPTKIWPDSPIFITGG